MIFLCLQKFLYMKLTEYLEDFHPWFSIYSRPSSSSHTYTQRSSVCLLLLQGYMCVNTLLINLLEEQVFNTEINTCQQTMRQCVCDVVWFVFTLLKHFCCFLLCTTGQCFLETGLIDVPAVCMLTGVCSALAVMPVGGLVSLVFRVSKVRNPRLLKTVCHRVKYWSYWMHLFRQLVYVMYDLCLFCFYSFLH